MLIKSKEFNLPSQGELAKQTTEIEVVVVDVAEIEIERPKKNRNCITAVSNAVTG